MDPNAADDIKYFEAFPNTSKVSKAAQRAAKRAAKLVKNLPTQSERLFPKNETQKAYFDILRQGDPVISVGPAGTGKTYVAARFGARRLVDQMVDKLVIARVTVSDPKHALGFLPGKLDAKLGPWVVPVIDGVRAEVGNAVLERWKQEGKLEIASFEHMRGRTFRDTVLILDEAQNATYSDLRLLLTRIGENCQVIITGDLDQIDIPNSGLGRIMEMAVRHGIPMHVIAFSEDDVVRSEFTKAWVKAFKAEDNFTIRAQQPVRQSATGTASVTNLDDLPRFLHNARTVTKPA